jgi:hypothetical protein
MNDDCDLMDLPPRDQRDFHIIRPKYTPHFEVLPQTQ